MPAIPIELLRQLGGRDECFFSGLHHGAKETPLDKFAHVLNLDEIVVFLAGSWVLRDTTPSFQQLVENSEIYEIFNYVNKGGFPWLAAKKKISEELGPIYESFNPYCPNEKAKGHCSHCKRSRNC